MYTCTCIYIETSWQSYHYKVSSLCSPFITCTNKCILTIYKCILTIYNVHCMSVVCTLYVFLCRALGLLAAKMSGGPSQQITPSPSSSTPEYSTPALTAPSSTPATPVYPTPALATLTEGLRQMLVRASSAHRVVAALTIGCWGRCPDELLTLLNSVLRERTTHEEITPFVIAMQRECHVRLLEITGDYCDPCLRCYRIWSLRLIRKESVSLLLPK